MMMLYHVMSYHDHDHDDDDFIGYLSYINNVKF